MLHILHIIWSHAGYIVTGLGTLIFIAVFPPFTMFLTDCIRCGAQWIKYVVTREEPLPEPPFYEFDLEDDFKRTWVIGAISVGAGAGVYGLGRLISFLLH